MERKVYVSKGQFESAKVIAENRILHKTSAELAEHARAAECAMERNRWRREGGK